jgi:hypothetical protein
MIEKKKMSRCWIAGGAAPGLVHLFRFAYPGDPSGGLDQSLQGLVSARFSPFAGAHARDPLPGAAG